MYMHIAFVQPIHNCDLFSATFDVQQAQAKLNSDKIEITGEFINNSLARGFFVVFQCHDNFPDQFRVASRNDSEQTVSESFIVPRANYSMYVYDLEEDTLPNPQPAITQSDMIYVDANMNGKLLMLQYHVFSFTHVYSHHHCNHHCNIIMHVYIRLKS